MAAARDSAIDAWLAALHERHVAPWRPQEFTRALRALSARYVERRGELPDRSPLDSAGKRAAFAAFYAPLHLITTAEIINRLAADETPSRIADLGCGTGVCGAAWALSTGMPSTDATAASSQTAAANAVAVRPAVFGVDQNAWAVDEARWNLAALGVDGRVTRADLLAALHRPQADAVVAGWSVNELPSTTRHALLPLLLSFGRDRGPVLILEPLARGAAPWWDDWAAAFRAAGGRADEWKIRVPLPSMLQTLSQRADFDRDGVSARSLFLSPRAARSADPHASPVAPASTTRRAR